ncbi:TPA: hypothetical protein DD425_03135 [Candidatus Saccharibacteria bacterium]|nr:hypothetical protein [Candidatus Saccharibacteria bacterium]
MKNITVTKVGILSIGKLVGTVNVIVALFVGIIASIVGTTTYLINSTEGFFDNLLASLAIILTAVILYPLVMFALGWLYGIVVSFIFNVVIGVSGGVGLTVEEERVTKK